MSVVDRHKSHCKQQLLSVHHEQNSDRVYHGIFVYTNNNLWYTGGTTGAQIKTVGVQKFSIIIDNFISVIFI